MIWMTCWSSLVFPAHAGLNRTWGVLGTDGPGARHHPHIATQPASGHDHSGRQDSVAYQRCRLATRYRSAKERQPHLATSSVEEIALRRPKDASLAVGRPKGAFGLLAGSGGSCSPAYCMCRSVSFYSEHAPSRVARTEFVITAATNGAAPACSVQSPSRGFNLPLPIYRPPL
jgi:hypothetical protein